MGVVEHGSDVVDDLVNGDRFWWQVCAGVVVARHSHPAVLDHDDVEPGCGGAAPQPFVHLHRRHPRDRPG